MTEIARLYNIRASFEKWNMRLENCRIFLPHCAIGTLKKLPEGAYHCFAGGFFSQIKRVILTPTGRVIFPLAYL